MGNGAYDGDGPYPFGKPTPVSGFSGVVIVTTGMVNHPCALISNGTIAG